MELYRLIIPKDDAWRIVEALGNTDAAHFVDLNKNEQPFMLPYQQRIKVCDDTERKVHYLISKCTEYRIQLFKPKSIEVFEAKVADLSEDMRKASHLLFDAIEQDVADKEAFVCQMAKQIDDMQS
jgi:V-type H+-transporting ATPase subunit a